MDNNALLSAGYFQFQGQGIWLPEQPYDAAGVDVLLSGSIITHVTHEAPSEGWF